MHRDIKPANILLHEGKCKLGDFGFAKSLTDDNAIKNTYLGIFKFKFIFIKRNAFIYGTLNFRRSMVYSKM